MKELVKLLENKVKQAEKGNAGLIIVSVKTAKQLIEQLKPYIPQ